MVSPLDASALRQQLVAVARRMNASGINQGTSGNLSARIPGGMLITPSSLPYEQMQPDDLIETAKAYMRSKGYPTFRDQAAVRISEEKAARPGEALKD